MVEAIAAVASLIGYRSVCGCGNKNILRVGAREKELQAKELFSTQYVDNCVFIFAIQKAIQKALIMQIQ